MEMSTILTQMAILVIMMLVGFVCAKTGLTGPAFNKAVSPVVMNVLLVSTILSSVMGTEIALGFGEILKLIGLMTLMLIIVGIISEISPKALRMKGDDAGLTATMILFMNTAFVAYPVIQSIYGPEGIFYASMSGIPFNVMIFTYGLERVRNSKERRFALKSIVNPPIIATIIAIIIMVAKIPVPGIVVRSCSMLSGATVPMSMLVVGTSLGGIALKDVFLDWKGYVFSLIRLIICPIAVWFIMRMIVTDKMLLDIIVILASAPVAMMVSVFTIQFDKNEALASKTIFISTLLSAVTMPLIIWLFLM